MRPGPKRKPAEKALRQGNPGKRKRKDLEAAAAPAPAATVPTIAPPPGLLPGIAAVWRTYTQTPIGQLVVKAGDVFALERLCTYWYEWRELSKALQDSRTRTGLRLTEKVKRERYGTVSKVRPEALLRTQIEKDIRALEAKFGADPSSRAAVMQHLAEARDATKPAMSGAPGSAPRDDTTPDGVPPPPSSPIGALGARKLN